MRKYFNISFKIVVALLLLWVMYQQVFGRENIHEIAHIFKANFQLEQSVFLIGTLLLMPINWLFETLKWRTLIWNFEQHGLWQSYKAILVERQSYLLELSRYIVLNPVRAEMVRSAKDWRWSSYRAMAGQAKAEAFLDVEWLLASFGGVKSNAINAYRRFISEGKGQPSPWKGLKNQVYLGSDNFVTSMVALI